LDLICGKKQIIMPWKETTTVEQKIEFICVKKIELLIYQTKKT